MPTYLDLARLLFFGEHTEQESSEQLLTELAEGDRRQGLCGGDRGERGLAVGRDKRLAGDDIAARRLPAGERRDTNDRPLAGGDRRDGGDLGERLPAGERRDGGDRGERRLADRERLRRPFGDGEDDPSI